MHEVFFVSQERKINVSPGTSLLDAAHHAGILLESPCNREGICGKCKVAVDGDSHSSLCDGQGDRLLRAGEEGDEWVLGCQVY
ncbi:MAG: 2Fe-2S iron-sulfur cluster-binding protein, partial [Chlorobium sp.]